MFREMVSYELRTLWPERSRAMASCGKASVEVVCKGCSEVHLVPYRCGARSCPTCAGITSAVYANKVIRRAKWSMANRGRVTESADAERVHGPLPAVGGRLKWRFLTLTTRAPELGARRFMPRYARAKVMHTKKAFGKFWRTTPWGKLVKLKIPDGERVDRWGEVQTRFRRTTRARRDTAFVMGLETAPGGMVHIHVAVFGEYVHWSLLKILWNRALGYTAKIDPYSKTQKLPGDVKAKKLAGETPAQLEKSLHEVLKYATKGEGRSATERATRAALIEYAYRNVRRVEFGGFLRKLPEVTQLELATATHSKCETDGCEPPAPGESRFIWRGVHAVTVTGANGGYGKLTIDPRSVVRGRYYADDWIPPPWWDAPAPDADDVLTEDVAPDWDELERKINGARECHGLEPMTNADWREWELNSTAERQHDENSFAAAMRRVRAAGM